MTHPALALQAAVVAALGADAGVSALVGTRIYDVPPREVTFPYVTIGPANVTDWSTSTEAGAEHRLELHIWSRQRGKKETYEIMAALEAALDERRRLPLTGTRSSTSPSNSPTRGAIRTPSPSTGWCASAP